ncbi:hypothetical protein STVA_25510 [Allostella vacuolata]|nr:hypothetical protein STVA_25510 [Stella vacuolata]
MRLGDNGFLPGLNRLAAGSVAVAAVRGRFEPGQWAAVIAHCRTVGPAGLAPVPPEPRPAGLRDAVESLARHVCAFMEVPLGQLRRTPLGEASGGTALLPTGLAGPGETALVLAIDLIAQAVSGPTREADVQPMRERLLQARKATYDRIRGARRHLIRVAIARGIPWRFSESAGDLLLLGEGRRAVRFFASASERTDEAAELLAGNKHVGNAVLRRAGVPVARQQPVRTPADIRRLAAEVGYPVVIKPISLRLQLGVEFVFAEDQVERALARSASHGQPLVAESYLPGPEHRLLVVDGEVIGSYERPAPQVTGDGVRSIAELAAAVSAEPDRGDRKAGFPLARMVLDEVAVAFLKSRGWTLDSIPPPGVVVETHPLPFIAYGGGRRIDRSAGIHPDNRALAVRALAVLGLDIGGVDLRCPDIGQSWRKVGAGICEVNPRPDIGAHYLPGLDHDVAAEFVDRRGPADGDGRMPQVVLLGEGDLDGRANAAGRALARQFGWKVGVATPGRVDIDGYVPQVDAPSPADAYGMFAESPFLDAAVYATSPAGLAAGGLGAGHVELVLASPGPARVWKVALDLLKAGGARVLPLPRTDGAVAAAVVQAMQRFANRR